MKVLIIISTDDGESIYKAMRVARAMDLIANTKGKSTGGLTAWAATYVLLATAVNRSSSLGTEIEMQRNPIQ